MAFFDSKGNVFRLTPNDVLFSERWSPHEGTKTLDPEFHLAALAKIAESKGGALAPGQTYSGSDSKLLFSDSLGREFYAVPSSIKAGTWSPYESGNHRNAKIHMAEIHLIAKQNGWTIPDGQIYGNKRKKLRIIDSQGNEFQMSPELIKRGSRSPYEAKKVYKDKQWHYEQMELIAKSRGGRIADGQEYSHSHQKMGFFDSNDRYFEMTPTNVKSGKWSPFESGRVKCPLHHMSALVEAASQFGGKVAPGETYQGNKTKMRFIDKDGNEFLAFPGNVKRGHWGGTKPR